MTIKNYTSTVDVYKSLGETCPCCGRPIKSRDPEILRLLTVIAATRRLPTEEECNHEEQ